MILIKVLSLFWWVLWALLRVILKNVVFSLPLNSLNNDLSFIESSICQGFRRLFLCTAIGYNRTRNINRERKKYPLNQTIQNLWKPVTKIHINKPYQIQTQTFEKAWSANQWILILWKQNNPNRSIDLNPWKQHPILQKPKPFQALWKPTKSKPLKNHPAGAGICPNPLKNCPPSLKTAGVRWFNKYLCLQLFIGSPGEFFCFIRPNLIVDCTKP